MVTCLQHCTQGTNLYRIPKGGAGAMHFHRSYVRGHQACILQSAMYDLLL